MKVDIGTLKLRWPWTARASQAGAAPEAGLEPTIYGFILRHSYKRQLAILALTLISFTFLYYSLSLPKTIINQAIGGRKFPQTFLFWQMDQVPFLIVLCALFLALVFINGAFKYYINLYKGQLGERMLRRLRYELYHRVLRFPVGHFRRISSAEIIPMITAEVEPLGGFIGDAFVLPVFQGGTLLTIIAFMFIQDPVLGAAAVALYPVQGYVIPKLQRKVNQLGKQRVRTIRQVADKVGESAAGIVEIHANDAVRLQLAHFSHLLGTIYKIRFEIYNRKFFVKFLNNFLGQLTPFFFYLIGGYLVIRGNLSFGALVAVLAAYKDLASPWKELLDFYQLMQDSHIKYEQVIEQFQPSGLVDRSLQLDPPDNIPPLVGEVVASNLSLSEGDRGHSLEGISFSFQATAHVAIVGQSNSGKNELALLLARLVMPTGGRITIGGSDLAGLHMAVVGRRLGYSSAAPHFFSGTLRENLLLGLRNRPLRRPHYDERQAKAAALALFESRQSGNIELDIDADWVDYDAAGVADEAGLMARAIALLRRVDLEDDVYHFGLRGRLNPQEQPEVTERLLEARRELARELVARDMVQLVEPFDSERYNTNASVAENLLFGTPTGTVFDIDQLARNPFVLKVLDKTGLTRDLVSAGAEVAETMIELFSDLPPEHEFFEQYSFISAGDLPEFQVIVARVRSTPQDKWKAEDRERLMSMTFKLIAARHRLGLLDAALQGRILAARKVFAADLPASLRREIEFFDASRYNAAASVEDNVLFGKIAYGQATARTSLPAIVRKVLEDLGLRAGIVAVGLGYNVGTGGSRLSTAQRQRAALVRALLKRPDILILNEATAALDGQTQAKVMAGVKEECARCGIVWVLNRASDARRFDHVMVLDQGRLVEAGAFQELDRPGTTLHKLMAADA